MRVNRIVLPALFLAGAIVACAQSGPAVVYVTATPARIASIEPSLPNPFLPTWTPSGPTATAIEPTPNPTYPPLQLLANYTIESGDTLATIAQAYGTSVDQLLGLNPGLSASSTIFVGQVINVPSRPTQTTPNVKLIPDSELVNSPGARGFDIFAYIKFQPGFIRVYSEEVPTLPGQPPRVMSGAEIIQFVSTSASVNPRLLLALLEYRGHWITNPAPDPDSIAYPMGNKDPQEKGLFKQVNWAANTLNAGYYGWKYRGMAALKFSDNSRLAFAPELNPGSVAVQYFLSQSVDRATWQNQVQLSGFLTTYMAMFGDPFRLAYEPLIPPDLQQPAFQLPFKQGETWYFTAGPHGGWDNNSGWSAIDFAPPRPPDSVVTAQGYCYVSANYGTAVIGGLITRSGDGQVVIDVNMDGDERVGWTVVYLHVAAQDSVKAGTVVQAGQAIGHPSCEGFYLNALATHLHVARRYNGEWIAADCWACAPGVPDPPYVLGGWTVKGYPAQVYQGWLENQGKIVRADQGKDTTDNIISW